MPVGFRVASAWVDVRAEDKGLRQQIRAIVRNAARGQDVKIPVRFESKGLRRELDRALRRATRGQKSTVPVRIDSKGLRRELSNALKTASRGQKTKIPLNIDATGLRREIKAKFKEAIAGQKYKLPLHVDPKGLRREIARALRAATAGQKPKIKIGIDSRGLRAEIRRAVRAAALGQRVNVPIHLDPNSLRNASGHMSHFMKIVLAAVALIPPGIASVVHAFQMVAPASAVLVTTLTALVTLGATVAVGMNGVGEAIEQSGRSAKDYKEALDRLTPSARAFVESIVESKGAFKGLQQQVQEALFNNLAQKMREMAKQIIPDLRAGLGGMAMVLNDMTEGIMANIVQMSRMGTLKQMFGGIQLAMEPLVDTPGQILNAIVKLTIAATPLFIRMTEAAGRGMDRLTERVNRGFESGQLQASINRAANVFMNFFRQIGNNPEWQKFINKIQETGPSVNRMVANVSEALLKILNGLAPVAAVVRDLIDLFAQLINAMPSEMVTTIVTLVAALMAIGKVITIVGALVGVLGRLRGAIVVLGSQTAMIAAIQTRLAAIGMSAAAISRTATAMRFLGRATLAAGVLYGVYKGIEHLGNKALGAAPNVKKLAESLIILSDTGKFTGELKETFTSLEGVVDLANQFNKAIDKQEKRDDFSPFGFSVPVLDDISHALSKPLQKLNDGEKHVDAFAQKFDALDKAMSKNVRAGYGKEMAMDFTMLKDAWVDSGRPLKDFTQHFPKYAAAVKAAAKAEADAARSMGVFGAKAVETSSRLKALKSDTEGLTKSLFALNEANRDAESSMGDFQQSADDLAAAAKKRGVNLKFENGMLSQNTQAQRDASNQMLTHAQNTEKAGLAAYMANGNWAQSAKIFRSGRADIVKAAQAWGLSKTEAQAYADTILKIPSKKEILLLVKDQASKQFADVYLAYKNQPNKKTITVETLSKPAILALEALGFKVKQLPDGTFSVTAQTKGAKTQLDDLEKFKFDNKTVTALMNIVDVNTKIKDAQSKVDGLKQKRKTAVGADKRDLDAKVKAAQGKLDALKQKRAAEIKALDGTAPAVSSALRRLNSVKSRTVTITASVVYTAKNPGLLAKAHGRAKGGLAPRYAKGGYADGGNVQMYPGGGLVQGPGGPTSDSILAMMANGPARISDSEYIMRASAVRKYGVNFMNALNAGRMPQIPQYAVGGYTKKRKVGKKNNRHWEYYYQGRWYDKAGYDKAYGAAKDLASDTTFSHFGKVAKSQGTFHRTEIENQLGRPENTTALVSALNSYRSRIIKSTSGKEEYNLLKKINSSGKKLIAYEDKLSKVNSSLEKAKESLDDLKGKFDSLKSSVQSNVMEFGNITKIGKYGTSPSTLITQLTQDAGQATKFADMLSQLKAKGVNSQLIADIGEAGITGGGMATAMTLLNASPEDIAKINALQKQLTSAADKAGTVAAESMYGAGIKAAEGLVAGLTKEQKAIEDAMMKIAKAMEASIKKALGIKSPARVMVPLGKFTALGYAKGITDNANEVALAATQMARIPAQRVGASPAVQQRASVGGTINTGSSVTHIECINITVPSTMDLTKPDQRRAVAKALVDDIKEQIRLSDKKRK